MWHCVNCREEIEDSFDVCWKCGTSVDGSADPDFVRVPDECGSVGAAPDEPVEGEGVVGPLVCAKCGGAMEEGFLRDVAHGATLPAHWVQGRPEWSFWRGTKTFGKEQRRMQAFRCGECGLVEFYAK